MRNFYKALRSRINLSRTRGALVHVQGAPLYAAGAWVWKHRVVTSLLLVVCVFGVELGLLALPKANAAYTIANSARFISGNSDYLTRTPGSAGSRTTWTFSTWVKMGSFSASTGLFEGFSTTNDMTSIGYDSSTNKFYLQEWINGTTNSLWYANGAIRDPAAWYHLVVVFDTTQASPANMVKMYINGVPGTTYSLVGYSAIAQNFAGQVNNTVAQHIGLYQNGSPFEGYMSDIYLVDGQALDPTSFGQIDANGYWRPKAYSGTYGTNGFHLAFGNGAALGTDTSGNSNTFTASGLAATDQVTDTPTNSFATLNPLDVSNTTGTGNDFSKGNLAVTTGAAGARHYTPTFGSNSGKWYAEATVDAAGSGGSHSNYVSITVPATGGAVYAAYDKSGDKYSATAGWTTGWATFTTGDVIGIAYDTGAGSVSYYKNNTLQGTLTGIGSTNLLTGIGAYPQNSGGYTLNYGQGGQSGLTYDSASGGTFKYTPPSGYKAYSTNNLTAPTIAQPNLYFNAQTFGGTGATQSIGSVTKVETYSTSTTWTAPSGVTSVQYLVVAGGGGGGRGNGGGGGAGGMATGTLSVTPGASYTVTVGAGGLGSNVSPNGDTNGTNGGNSVFSSVTATGGGGGGRTTDGSNGGSGGGGGNDGVNHLGGTGTAGQGHDGAASGGGGTPWPSGGGGGAGTAGTVGTSGGGGGNGAASSITGISVTYAGGGGGGASAGGYGTGGTGGGGAGATGSTAGTSGTNGLGGGGGGAATGAGGNGGSGVVIIRYTTSTSFQPDLVWIKDRTSALMHSIYDSVRAVYAYLSSDSTAAEVGGFGQTLTAFTSTGFTLGTNSLFNTSGNNYISWLWKESSTSGMEIITYTGNGQTTQNISHNLGVEPKFVIGKRRDGTGAWAVFHDKLTTGNNVRLNTTAAEVSWDLVDPTTSIVTVANTSVDAPMNTSGVPYVMYVFAEKDGFSKFGSYTGNGSADGPFVYTGFKPRFIMWFDKAGGGNWEIRDTARSTYNPATAWLAPNLTNADAADASIDILSNGFKIRSDSAYTSTNANGNTYIYAAFAEQPFQQSAQPYNLTIASSTRFISGNSDYLSKTPAGAGNRQKWTQSLWFKRGTLATQQALFTAWSTVSAYTAIEIGTDDKLDVYSYDAGYSYRKQTSAVFRDPAAWQHLVVAVDTTNAIASQRVRVYINGSEITAWTVSTDPSQNYNTWVDNTVQHNFGRRGDASLYTDSYMADAYIIDGAQLAPSCFGETDANGYWRPKTYSTASPCAAYGTNGFHLPLTTTSPGTDTSGNSNTFTASGLAATDNVADSPTNTSCTWNPLDKTATLTEGNLKAAATAATRSNIQIPSTGKWHFEVDITSKTYIQLGISRAGAAMAGGNTGNFGFYDNGVGTHLFYDTANTNTYLATGFFANGDTLVVDVDSDNSKAWMGRLRSGTLTYMNSGQSPNPASGTAPLFGTGSASPASTISLADGYYAGVGSGGSTETVVLNCGQGGISGTSYDSAAGGYFKSAPPSGFKALSTANLATPAVAVPKNYFDAVTYRGTGAVQSITGSTTILSFTSTGTTTWMAPAGVTSVEYLVVGGGGGGGSNRGGGGGAGGFLTGTQSVTAGSSYTVVVGAGGAGGGVTAPGVNGNPSKFDSIVSFGGGGGGSAGGAQPAGTVGSGGGGGGDNQAGKAGTVGQGNAGGTGLDGGSQRAGGGGGGAGAAGANGSGGGSVAGNGGAGTASSISGSSVTYAGGGGGAVLTSGTNGTGGAGGGGAGQNTTTGTAGTANTGGGGGAGGSDVSTVYAGGAGGSGIVIIKYTATASIQPDLVWIKDRTSANAHGIFDSSRTLYPAWASSASIAEGGAGGTALSAFLSNGFSLGASSTVNTLGDNFVAWLWKKCPAIVAVLCPASNGVDIVAYTGDNTSNRTVSHSLGAAPEFVIVKRRDSTGDPYVWHTSFSGATTFALLDSTAATSTSNSPWGTGSFGASTFMVTNNATNNLNASAATYVAYLFKGIDGFSKFGSYTGNGSADGPFVYTGFKPRFVMIKRADNSSGGSWVILDSARVTYNPLTTALGANLSNADIVGDDSIDFLSNGFKMREGVNRNASGGTYVYAAFAEQPFKYSAAPAASASSLLQAIAFLMGMTF